MFGLSQSLPSRVALGLPCVCEAAAAGGATRRLTATAAFSILEISPNVEELGVAYCDALGLPQSAWPDAFHLAVASLGGMEYLVSWNCRHIVSGRVRRAVREINDLRDIESPIICTPEELQDA